MGGAEIRISDPVVSFRETVNQMSDHIVMSKSPNKHNRCVLIRLPLAHKRVKVLQHLFLWNVNFVISLRLLCPAVLCSLSLWVCQKCALWVCQKCA